MNGIDLIATERQRQIDDEGYSAEHDDEHAGGELALAAIAYAAPVKVFTREERANSVWFYDPIPWNGDKRFDCKVAQESPSNVIPDPLHYTPTERVDLLVKAGALIAAEIDRLLRLEKAGRDGE